jgi:uncharacterized protein YukJ
MPINNYGLVKGRLVYGVPYYSKYRAKPHYVFVLDVGGGTQATVVVNSMSDDGTEVGIYADFAIDHPITQQLDTLPFGFPKSFPRFDYARDPLIKDVEWTPLPYEDDGHGGSTHTVNDLLSQLAEVVVDGEAETYDFFNGQTTQQRDAFRPSTDVTVYALGQTFDGGVHDAHMSQGTPEGTNHAKDNGIYQDGALFFQVGAAFRGHFTVFSSQELPTDARGYPRQQAMPVVARVREPGLPSGRHRNR